LPSKIAPYHEQNDRAAIWPPESEIGVAGYKRAQTSTNIVANAPVQVVRRRACSICCDNESVVEDFIWSCDRADGNTASQINTTMRVLFQLKPLLIFLQHGYLAIWMSCCSRRKKSSGSITAPNKKNSPFALSIL